MSRTIPYVPQDTIDEAREAVRTGTAAIHVAAQLGLTIVELNVLLGRPQWKPIPEPADREIDLWAAEDVL